MVTGDSGELDQSVAGKREIECISATLVGVDPETKKDCIAGCELRASPVYRTKIPIRR